MDANKLHFISTEAIDLLDALEANSPAKWGVMNAHQMTEHLEDFFNVSTEKFKVKLYTPEEHLPRMKEFLMSDKVFRENTKAPVEILGETPLPLRFISLTEAKENLKAAINNFSSYFENDKQKKTLHPAFGMLNYEEWILLHYKHVQHHLKQFGLIPA